MLLLLKYLAGRAPYLLPLLLAGQCEAQHQPAQAPPAPASPAKSALLLGRWQSVTDPRFTVTITPTAYVEHYPDSAPATLHYALTNSCRCDAAKQTPDKRLLVTYETSLADCYCYSIDQLDARHLVLLYLGRGNRLAFKRLK